LARARLEIENGANMDRKSGPDHHPGDDMLLDYAAGRLTGARALVVATHLAYCPACRTQVQAAEVIGGECFELEHGVDLSSVPDPEIVRQPATNDVLVPEGGPFAFAPRHLRALLAASGGEWVNVWFGVKEMPISGFSPSARLLWIPAGRRMPRHDHRGDEMTLVLKGSFSDATGRYAAGDLQVGGPGLDHQPLAGVEGPCICLVAEEGGLKLSGWLGRLVAWRGGQAGRHAA
jgi:putative transcriptional regulator